MDRRMAIFWGAWLVIAFVVLAGCSEKPVPRPDLSPSPTGSLAPATQKITPALSQPVQTSAPVMTQPVLRTPAPQSLDCPAGYVQGEGGDTLCYAQCNPGKRCRSAGDFCCGTSCCPQGSVCCGGSCYPAPCECSGGRCITSSYERPAVVVNAN